MNSSYQKIFDEKLYESYAKLINHAYPHFLKRLGIDKIAVRAEGATITDSSGKIYIDCIGGYGLFNIGHNHPKIIQALKKQLDKKELFSKPLITEVQVRLAEKFNEITPASLSCSFVSNSGSEAIDNAIKLARLYKGKKEIITATNSFHGYTFGALSASGILSFKKLFEPLVPGIIHVPFGDIKALENAVTPDTAAILLEPIQHEAGVVLPPEDYFHQIRSICDEKDIIFILDEIKTGLGKTGQMFAFEHFGIVPDILALGKSLGGGLMPVGALIATKKFWKKFGLSFPMSASSFAGNSLTSRAALSAIKIIQEESLVDDCRKKGIVLIGALKNCIKKHPGIFKSINGLGLLIGIETVQPQKTIGLVKEMVRSNVLTTPAFGNPAVLMIEPPLVISFDQIQKVVTSFENACKTLLNAE